MDGEFEVGRRHKAWGRSARWESGEPATGSRGFKVPDASRESRNKPDGPEGTSGRRKPDAWPPEEPEEERKAQAGRLNQRQRRRTRRSAQAERVGRRKAGDGIYSRCEIVNDEGARGSGLWRFRFRTAPRRG